MPVVAETHQLASRALSFGCECGRCLLWVKGCNSAMSAAWPLFVRLRKSRHSRETAAARRYSSVKPVR